MIVSPGAGPGAATSVNVTAGAGSQASIACAGSVGWPHSTVASAGTWSAGAVVSPTWIVWTPLAWFPQASVAVHVRAIVNSSGHAPGIVTSECVMTGAASQ